jgi:hypothetical protein
MLSIMQIDGLAKRYGKLPSEIMSHANTFDLYIIDAAITYEQYHHKKAMNKGQEPLDNYTTEDLLTIYNKGKENSGPIKTKTS